MDKNNFDFLLMLLQSHVAVIPFREFSGFLHEAEELMMNLKLEIPIWSNDLHFKKQNRIISYTTDEIISNFIEMAH